MIEHKVGKILGGGKTDEMKETLAKGQVMEETEVGRERNKTVLKLR